MKALVTVDGHAGELQFDREGAACRFSYSREDRETVVREASLIEVEPGVFSIAVGGRVYDARVTGGALDGYSVEVAGRRVAVEVRDPRGFNRKSTAGTGEGRQNVAAQMPGKVVRVLVEEGEEVEAGAGLVVVEAMKMQNEMKSPKTGRVTRVAAREGDTVAAGDVLAVIE